MDFRCVVAALAFSAPTLAVADGGHGSTCCGEGATGGYCCGDFGSPCEKCGNYTYGVTCTQAGGHTYNCPCGKLPGQCHSPLPPDFEHVNIRFDPQKLGSGEGVGQSDCPEFEYYRLASRENKLHLVAMDKNDNIASCVQDWKEGDLTGFTIAHEGIFDGIPNAYSFCLELTTTARLQPTPQVPCTRENNFLSEWKFTQNVLGTQDWCMGDVLNTRPPVVDQENFPTGKPASQGCGGGWSKAAFKSGFEEALSSAAEPKTCDDCTDMYGGFACLWPNGTCTVTPGQEVCESAPVNGEWCMKPRGSGSICCGTGTEYGGHCCHNFGSPCTSCGNSDNGVTCTQADGNTHNCPCYLDACNDAKADNATNIVV